MMKRRALVWLRRDLRLEDHAPLAHAAALGFEVAVAFIFDPSLLEGLDKTDRRVGFIHQSLTELEEILREKNSSLVVKIGDPAVEIPKIARALGASLVVAGRDYEPLAKSRDEKVRTALGAAGVSFVTLKDQVVFEGLEVKTKTDTAFKVFTPYKNAWLAQLNSSHYEERDASGVAFVPAREAKNAGGDWSLARTGFAPAPLWLEPGSAAARARLAQFRRAMPGYESGRNFPAQAGTSGISVHLRFGTISVRAAVREALRRGGRGADVWLGELIWRDFYHMILDQNPHVVSRAFRPEYERLRWPGKESHFRAWCEGRTGFPLVDAAMRHLRATGWMHNRLRMVVASFLTKDLLVDYRLGEQFFARHLLDFDLAANNGGWQWSASTGCDAQPYFRIFNPYSQSERFDPRGDFIRSVLPELKSVTAKEIHRPDVKRLRGAYPAPIVDHGPQRDLAIHLFKSRKKEYGQEKRN